MRKTISLVLAVLLMLALLPAVKLNSSVADATAVTDALTLETTGVSGNSYADWTYTSEASGATYVGQSAGGNDSIQLRSKNNNSGIVATKSNGTATKIVVDWNENTYSTRVLNVYGSNTAYTSAADLYDDNAGTLLGTITYVQGDAESTETEFAIEGSYAYIGLRSKDSALYLNEIDITWAIGGTPDPDPEPVDPEPEPEPEPEGTEMELVTELEDGDEVVIYYPTESKVMTGEDYFYNNKKHELVAADATLTDGVLMVPDDALLLTVGKETGEDEITRYTFTTADGKFLEADGTHVQLVEEAGANTIFQLEPVEGGYYIKCDSAQYSGKAQYIEFYGGAFTVYGMGSNTAIYTFQFFAEPKDEPIDDAELVAVVLFTNDVHCGIRDGWGYAGLADLKKTLEKEGNEVILVDAGDHVQGGPIGSLTQGEAIIDIMNFVGYDLATLGNHEFDYGMDQMFALTEQAEFPYVSANFVKVEGNEAVLDAYKIFEANGKKIAFVGLSTPESITKSTPTYFMNEDNTAYVYGFCQDATGEGVYAAAQAAIDAARAEGADYVILVGHMGIDEQSSPWMSTEVIANITGADAFIDGHSHCVINTVVEDKEGHGVLHGQTGTKLANVGKLTIDAEGNLSLEMLSADEKVKDDPETDEYIAAIEAEFNELLNSVVAHTDHDLTVNDPDTGARAVRSKETNLGDLCADAYRYMFDADIAFVNGGGVRANIPTGDITFQQIINVHPFGNTAVLAEVTGQQILDALEHGSASNPGESGGFLQVSGLKYEIHNYLPANEIVDDQKMWQSNAGLDEYRVKNVQVLNKETGEYEDLDLEKTYTLASHNYMLKDMGDGYAMFGANITILNDSGIADNKVLIDYIQSMPEVDGVHQVEGYTDPRGEGRITIVSEVGVTFYGEDVNAADVAEDNEDGKTLYRYDIKVRGINPETEVVGLQAYLKYDTTAVTFVEAKSTLEGSTGINDADGLVSFAWAANGNGITLEDETVVVSLYFELNGEVEDGQKVEFLFAESATGAATGYSYASESSVVEAEGVKTENGSITFVMPSSFIFQGEDVEALDVCEIVDGEKLYRYDIRVSDLPAAGLKVNSAQIFVSYDKSVLEFRKAEGVVDWTIGQKKDKLMAVWASDTEVKMFNDDVVLSLYFAAPNAASGQKVDIVFTTNLLGNQSAMSVVFGSKVVEIEAVTVDGSITFPTILLGDANCDGKITAADASMVLRSLVGLTELTAQGALNADVDGDGEITAEDAALILRYIVKLIEVFPAEE